MAKTPAAASKSTSSSGGTAKQATKQTSLLGFFGRPGQPPPSSVRSTATESASNTSGSKFQSPSKVVETQPQQKSSRKSAASSKVLTQSARSTGSAAISSLQNVQSTPDATFSTDDPASSSPLSTPDATIHVDDVDVDVTDVDSVAIVGSKEDVDMAAGADQDEEDDDVIPLRNSRRAAKKRVQYHESEDEGATKDSVDPEPKSTRPAKKRKVDDDDEFEMDGDEFEDADLDFALSQYDEKSPSMSLPTDVDDESDAPKKSKSQPTATGRPAPKRPPPKPLGSGAAGSSSRAVGGGGSASGSNMFMTQAERSKLDAKQNKRDEQDCFGFLRDLRDADMHRPDDPDYDPRTVYIPPGAWKDFTPFEKQFWEIKQNHFDTVLFFQKGKFYELYENDAEIGHSEFDLKLTDRVKMKMVGVPEQSFDFWAAKFLAAGYKVGKVEQAETAIGMEMRTKAGKANKDGGDKIVRRELASVFTNGTVVDPAFLAGDEASHCVAIKEYSEGETRPSAYGVCILDAATGQFELTYFEDDICRTKLETLFRQLRPKEILHAKGNLTVVTNRLLRNILPMSTSWVSLRPGTEFYDAETTRDQLAEFFGSEESDSIAVDGETKSESTSSLPVAIIEMLDQPLAMEALGGMVFYLRSLNMDKDLLSQKSFNVYDPIKKGETMVLDGQSLSHLEILINNEGTEEATLLQLLQRCQTPFGKRLFRIWLSMPLTSPSAINARLDAVEDLIDHPAFSENFHRIAKSVPDLERIISRIHAGKCKQADFRNVVDSFKRVHSGMQTMSNLAKGFKTSSIAGLLESAPDLTSYVQHISDMYIVDKDTILPAEGASEECDSAVQAVNEVVQRLDDVLSRYKKELGCKNLEYWHSSIGTKDVYQIQAPTSFKPPSNWTKQAGTKSLIRYVTPRTLPLIREVQEVRETRKVAFQNFFGQLLAEFDKDREIWLKTVRVVAELDCLLSLAKASADLDEPRCRPRIVESDHSFIDFKDLRHPAMCLRSDFISNDVQLGGAVPRQALLTGPNTAGKSTLCRMTAVAVIMAQLGAFVPASSATLSPIDKIQTRMGAYDNMFSSASTFKVELDECSKILKEAGPRSLVILDELGRGTSTYDGMAIAEAVLHHLATHNLPLGFFATHYGALTDDFQYHPNIRCMYMQTQVDNEKREVVCLYKLIPGRAESSYGTHVAHLAGVPDTVVDRAEQVSGEFFEAFKRKLATRRRSALPVVAQADFRYLMSLVSDNNSDKPYTNLGGKAAEIKIIRDAVAAYVG